MRRKGSGSARRDGPRRSRIERDHGSNQLLQAVGVMFKNAVTEGLRDSREYVSIHRINEDTEFLQITAALTKFCCNTNTFGNRAPRFWSDERSGAFDVRIPRRMAPLCHAASR